MAILIFNVYMLTYILISGDWLDLDVSCPSSSAGRWSLANRKLMLLPPPLVNWAFTRTIAGNKADEILHSSPFYYRNNF